MCLEGGFAVELLLAAPALVLDWLPSVVGEDVMSGFWLAGFLERHSN